MIGDGQAPVFGLPSTRGRGRGRGRGYGRGGNGGAWNGHTQGPSAGRGSVSNALDTFFPGQMDVEEDGKDQQQRIYVDNRNEDVQFTDEIDSKLGFTRYQEGPQRLGWLVNMHATSVPDEEHSSTKSAVDYYFLEQDGGSFKCTLLFKPYFYVICMPGSEAEVEEWLVRKFDRLVDHVESVEREDLQMTNHLTGCKRRLVKIVFRNVQDLLSVRRELQPIIQRNSKRSELVNAYSNEDSENAVREVEDSLTEMREYDVPYYLRVAIDKGIRVGLWYDVCADASEITMTQREDLVQRADPVVLAYDIETTKLPLKFPDANTDMIMMISYMIDGQGYLITNREVVAEDIEDFEYTPTPEFLGPFTIFNEPDERATIERFFEHICDARPTVLATYNGDSFDWPFVETRARHYGIDMRAATGWYRDEADEYKSRNCVHMDCLRWVKRDSYLPVGSQGLKAVTTAKLGYNPMEIDPEDMTRFAAEQPQTLAQYSVSDAVATYYLYMKYVHPFIFSLCNIIPLNPDEVLRKGSGTLCETLLMVEAYKANVAIPNKHADPMERSWDGHLVETETYVGGHVEALEAGVFRSDINMHFRVEPEGAQRLLDELDRALKFSIEVESNRRLEDIENYDEIRGQIAARLEELRDQPLRNEPPLLYHLDVAAMYPNIILTNRLQPDAIVNEAVCAGCDFNVPGKTCDRRMPWLWRGEFFPPKRSEVAMLRHRLHGEQFPSTKAGGAMRTFEQLGAGEKAAELRRRVTDYSKKVYHRLRETRVEEREAMVCQRENPFYVDTVRNFRDRRYVYKGLLKKGKRGLDDAVAAGDSVGVAAGRKLVVLYDSLQLAHKCILNSFYGYVMRKGARWHSLEMAGVVCLTGSRIIQMARKRVEQLGRPLELDTDGIWCALPRTFPENYSFRLRDGGSLGISYPCTMLNHLVHDQFTNHQYEELQNVDTHEYSIRSENSIFFEVDGPYRAMVLPASKEEDKLLKKRYAVFNDDGTLAELKGFEVKRRGELKLIKIFQSQIFRVFLEGTSLESCYAAVARVADQWLDILFSRARGLPDAELFELITENRSMSKALESYAGMKSTSLCTARRLAEFLGDAMVKDKGLACKFVISRQPQDLPVSERAIPVAIFSAEAPVRRQFLRRWLRDPSLETADIRDILDWGYYLERFGSVIQKLITIPAAMQGVTNPVPRIRHPDWLAKRVSTAANSHRQRHITDAFRKVSREEYLQKVADEDARLQEAQRDIEDIGAPGGTSALARPRAGVCRRGAKRVATGPMSVESAAARIAELGPAPDPNAAYGTWLAHAKQMWRLKRQLRALRLEAGVEEPADGAGLGQFFARTHESLARGTWQVLQWAETEVAGELKAWVRVGGQLHSVRVAVPRTLYVAPTVPVPEMARSAYFTEARSMVLPRAAMAQQSTHLYRCAMPEAEYVSHRSRWSSFFAHPSIGGVYETHVTPVDRALIRLGATAALGTAARRRGSSDAMALDDLEPRTASAPWEACELTYALLYQTAASDGRQFFALAEPGSERGFVWVVSPGRTAQLQLPNLERLYRESLAAAKSGEALDGGAFVYPEQVQFVAKAFSTAQAAARAVGAQLARMAEERRGTMVLVCHSVQPARRLQALIPAIGSFPTVAMPSHHADRALPALDWQRHASRRMVTSLLGCAQWVSERVALAQYADIPLGNIPADAPLFLADIFFARRLACANHVLWWSPAARPDLGGRQDDESCEPPACVLSEVNLPGSYGTACAELELRGLPLATVLKAPLVNELEGAMGIFGFDGATLEGNDNPSAAATDSADTSGRLQPLSTADGGVPAATLQLLRTLLRGWWQEAERENPFATMMTDHFYRWLTRPAARLFDPALAGLVQALMRKVFMQLTAELRRLGMRVVYANVDRIVVATGKATLPAAHASIVYVTRAVCERPLFEHLVLVPQQFWSFLLWMDASNYGGIATQASDEPPAESKTSDNGSSSTASEPRIEMLWSMKEYLPPVVQSRFELTVAEFIYKLAAFHSQLHSRAPHATRGPGAATAIEDVHSDDERPDADSLVVTKGAFYRRLIGQHFTRKLLAALPEIREACSPVHRSADASFPQLPGSQLFRDRRANPALEFVKYIATVFGLDVPATNFVRIMRRNLLVLLEIGEFAPEAEFTNPCERLVLSRVVCDFCNFCRDMDFCRDADLLPVLQEDGTVAGPSEWQCLGCGCAYDRMRIEERLVEQLHAAILAYQSQDLICRKCRLMKQDNFSLQCTSCAGPYKTTIDSDAIRAQISVYLDVAKLNRLTMLQGLAQWSQEHSSVSA